MLLFEPICDTKKNGIKLLISKGLSDCIIQFVYVTRTNEYDKYFGISVRKINEYILCKKS